MLPGAIDVEGLQAGTRIDMGEKQNPTDLLCGNLALSIKSDKWSGIARGELVFQAGISNVRQCRQNTLEIFRYPLRWRRSYFCSSHQ
jgi:hypothetical protein